MCLYNVFLPLCYWSYIHLLCSQVFLNVWSFSFILSSSLTAAILHLLKFSSTNSGKETKVQEQTEDNHQMELLHVENVAVVVHLDLREIKFVLLLSDQIFKIVVEWYHTGWQRCLMSAYASGVEDKGAWFSTVGEDKGSVDIRWTIRIFLLCWNIDLFHWLTEESFHRLLWM